MRVLKLFLMQMICALKTYTRYISDAHQWCASWNGIWCIYDTHKSVFWNAWMKHLWNASLMRFVKRYMMQIICALKRILKRFQETFLKRIIWARLEMFRRMRIRTVSNAFHQCVFWCFILCGSRNALDAHQWCASSVSMKPSWFRIRCSFLFTGYVT